MSSNLVYNTGHETFRLDSVDYISEVYERAVTHDMKSYGLFSFDSEASFCWKIYLSSGRKIIFNVDVPNDMPCGREWAENKAKFERDRFMDEWKEYINEL